MSLLEYREKLIDSLPPSKDVDNVIKLIEQRHGTIYTCGNGGSGSNASHFTQDLIKACGRPSLCLNDNIGLITAMANDLDFDYVFTPQLFVFPFGGDILFAISGSGNSRNVIKAVELSKANFSKIIALTGFDGGELAKLADYNINVASDDMRIIESAHSLILHYIIDRLEKNEY